MPYESVPSGGVRPLLSKSRYVSGLQCEKRLWLEVHDPGLGAIDGAQRAALDAGTAVGEHARGLFPGGVLVDEDPRDFAAALERTRALVADAAVPAIFEAAFLHEGVRIRVDVLERRPEGRWRLVEVKAGTSVKDVYLDDLAIQRFVLEGAGIALQGCDLVHVNGAYVRGCAGIHWPSYFRRTDQSWAVGRRMDFVPSRLERLKRAARAETCPTREPGRHCNNPYGCPFRVHCTAEKPDDWVGHLPRVSARRRMELRMLQIQRIGEIPASFPLGDLQRRIRSVLKAEAPRFAPGLADALRGAGPPAIYMDFEAMSPAVPLYPGTRPYQRIPFQWSMHRVYGPGVMRHVGFLAEPGEDPRRRFAQRLIDHAGGLTCREPILVYSGYETGVLAELRRAFPDLDGPIESIRSRLVDLLPIVRDHVYDPAFAGSFSLKAVAPALVPDLGYADLEDVSEGGEAALAFSRMVRGEVTGDDATTLRAALEAYCERDTLALAKLHHVLRQEAVA